MERYFRQGMRSAKTQYGLGILPFLGSIVLMVVEEYLLAYGLAVFTIIVLSSVCRRLIDFIEIHMDL